MIIGVDSVAMYTSSVFVKMSNAVLVGMSGLSSGLAYGSVAVCERCRFGFRIGIDSQYPPRGFIHITISSP